MTEWEAETGIGRMRWGRYEAGGSPRSVGDLLQVADVLGMTLAEMDAALNGNPVAPGGGSLDQWGKEITDIQFQQLCERQPSDRLTRWVSILTVVLASRIPDDSA